VIRTPVVWSELWGLDFAFVFLPSIWQHGVGGKKGMIPGLSSLVF
jgi:hypothetical protein